MPTRPENPGADTLQEFDPGLSTLVHRAVDDARELARAEIALVKAKAGERANAFKNAAILDVLAPESRVTTSGPASIRGGASSPKRRLLETRRRTTPSD